MEKTVGVCILAGGLSSRMGKDKATIKIGEETMLERVAKATEGFSEKWISLHDEQLLEGIGVIKDFQVLFDETDRIGPMGGIVSVLKKTKQDAVLVLACDMPFFSKEVAGELVKRFQETECDLCMVSSQDGDEPLACIYSVNCIPLFEKKIKEEDYRLRSILRECVVEKVVLKDKKIVYNVNTIEELGGLV